MNANDKLSFCTDYRSEKYFPGSIHLNGGDENDKIEVLGKSTFNNSSRHYYVVKFLSTGYIKRINSSQLSHKIDDPLKPTVYGRGVIGEGRYNANINGKHTKEGGLWYNMMMRCYSESYLKKTPTYKECEVCDRWLYFQNFCEDIQYLEGYNLWLEDSTKYVLDKDYKIKGNKLYSPETCMFISSSLNTIISNESKHKYIGISPEGIEFTFNNMRIFAEEHELKRQGIGAVINGDQLTHRGWKFEKLY